MISHNTTFIKSLQQNYSKFSVAFFNVYYKKKVLRTFNIRINQSYAISVSWCFIIIQSFKVELNYSPDPSISKANINVSSTFEYKFN